MESASLEGSVKILVLIGAVDDDSKMKYILASIKAGLEKWAKRMDNVSAMDECLALFSEGCKVFGHSDALAPHSKLAYTKNNISILVLFSPTCVMVNNGIAELILSPCSGRLVVYGGHFVDSQPNWFFQDGIFSVEDLEYVLNDKEIADTLLRTNIQSEVTVSCCEASQWKLSKKYPQVEMEFVDPFLPAGELTDGALMDGLKKFVNYLEETLKEQVEGIFFQLSPPKHKSFLRVQKPCIYLFPAGNGDSAFFKVADFNILVNGGALTRPWFWHLIRHEYRVDCVIATHLSNDSLLGLNSFLLRKAQERELKFPKDQDCDEFKYLSKFLLSPDLGEVFINAPSKFIEDLRKKNESTDESVGDSAVSQQLNIKTVDTVRDTFRLLKALQVQTHPLTRKTDAEGITLLEKYGVGKLMLFAITPDEDGKELDFVRQKWGKTDKSIRQMTKSGVKFASGEEGQSLVSDLASICCLLVWIPALPKERIIRVLFPGNTSETKIFEGLEKLKHLDYLFSPMPVVESSEKAKGTPKMAKPAASLRSKSSAVTKSSTVGKSSEPLAKSSSAVAKVSSTAVSKVSEAKRVTKTANAKSSQSAPKSSLARATTGKPTKTVSAPKKTSGSTKKPADKEENVTTRTKREGLNLANPAVKRPKAEKPQASQTLPAKSKKGPAYAKAEARIKTKRAAENAASKTTSATKPATTRQAKNFEFRKTVDTKSKKKIAEVDTIVKTSSVAIARSAISAPISDQAQRQEVSSLPETVIESLESLHQEISESREMMMKRPTPEGQDHAEQKDFSEDHADVELFKPQDKPSLEIIAKKHEDSKDEASYLTVSPNAKKQNDIPSEQGDVLDVETEEKGGESEFDQILIPASPPTEPGSQSQDLNPFLLQGVSKQTLTEDPPLEEFGSYQDEPKNVLDETPYQTDKEDFTVSDNTGNDSTLEPLSTEFTQLNMEKREKVETPDEVSQPREVAFEEQNVEPAQEEDDLIENFDQNEGFCVGNYEQDEAFDGVAAVTKKEDYKLEIDPETEDVEIEKGVTVEEGNEMTFPVSGSFSITPKSSPSPDLTESCDTETISEPEQKYLEIQESAPAKDVELMSYTPLSSGPSLSADNLQDIASPQDPPASGIVEFDNLDKDSALDLLHEPQVVHNSSSDISILPDPEPDIRTEADYCPYPIVNGTATDNEDVNQSENGCYDNNGNRTEANYKPDVGETQSRSDTILNWSPVIGVVPSDVRCDDDVVASDDVDDDVASKPCDPVPDHIVSFRDSQDNLIPKTDSESEKEEFEESSDEEERLSPSEGLICHPVETVSPQLPGDPTSDVKIFELGEDDLKEGIQDEQSCFHLQEDKFVDADPGSVLIQALEASSPDLKGKDSPKEDTLHADVHESSALQEEVRPTDQDILSLDEDVIKAVPDVDLRHEELSLDEDKTKSAQPTTDQFDDGLSQLHAEQSAEHDVEPLGHDIVSAAISEAQIIFPAHTEPGLAESCKKESASEKLVESEEDFDPSNVSAIDPRMTGSSENKQDVTSIDLQPCLFPQEELLPTLPTDVVPKEESNLMGMQDSGDVLADQGAKVDAPHVFSADNPFVAEISSPASPVGSTYSTPTKEEDPKMAGPSERPLGAKLRKQSATKKNDHAAFYFDLTYIPHHANKNHCGVEFFKRIRSKYYVLSGFDAKKQEPSSETLEALLEGKKTWNKTSNSEDTNVSVVPTHNSNALFNWYEKNHQELNAENIHLVSIGSRVKMHDENIEACKIEL